MSNGELQPHPDVLDLLHRLQEADHEREQTRVLLEDAQQEVRHLVQACDDLEQQLGRTRSENLRLAGLIAQRDAELASRNQHLRGLLLDGAEAEHSWQAGHEELHAALEELRATSDELAQSNRLLFQTNEQLERRVAERTVDLARSNRTQRQALEERELLLREVHHRVRNNMQTIASLLRLQVRRMSPELRAGLRGTLTRIQAMALTHELLSAATNLAHIDVGGCLESLATRLLRIHHADPGRVRLQVTHSPCVLDLDTATSLALIVSEAMSNALHHAFPDDGSGMIRIVLEETDAGRHLSIRDDGTGLPAGVEECAKRGLGFILMRALARQIGADLQITSAEGTGVAVHLPEPETGLAA